MGEDLDNVHDHKFIPTDDELDYGSLKAADPLLSDEEKEKLREQDMHGIVTAPQHHFSTLEEFKKGQNNFHAYFDLENRGIGPLYRRRKAFQRLVELHPDLVERATDQYKSYRHRNDFSDFGDDMWRDLYEAYLAIAQLVDMNDKYVIRQEDGKPDDYFLLR